MVKGDDIQERLISFAARVIRVCDGLPDSAAGQHIAGQLLRSGTAPAAHHAEARSAESPSDFVHKLSDLLDECIQLQRILNTSIKTARNAKRL